MKFKMKDSTLNQVKMRIKGLDSADNRVVNKGDQENPGWYQWPKIYIIASLL